jgi:hypothetical protein
MQRKASSRLRVRAGTIQATVNHSLSLTSHSLLLCFSTSTRALLSSSRGLGAPLATVYLDQ